MLFWPMVSMAGFVVLAALVIALGASSTARYEFERNRVQAARQQAVVPANAVEVLAGEGPPERPAGDLGHATGGSGGTAVQEQRAERGAAVSVANHPAGKRATDPGAVPDWWLVDEQGDMPGEVLAGPFADPIEADWAALAGGLSGTRVVYGVPRADGAGVVRRQLPQERAWLTELGDQLDRLSDDWDELLTDEDELTTLVVEVAAALVEAGLPLHDCVGEEPAGGVCLTPESGHRGIVVSWHRHDRMGRQQVRGAAMDAAVQEAMNDVIGDLLAMAGFRVEPFGSAGVSLVTVAESEG
ncbi:hypothetical protein [Modestobacter sp. URMC 112]